MAENARGRILRPSELIRAAGVARRYYVDGMSKVDIANELGISRFKVARVLEEAREAGLVHIEISVPAEIDADLSDALRSAFGLHDAIVVATGDDQGAAVRSQVGRVAATYLMEIIEEGDVIGLACSRTLHDMARALTELPKVTVVQLTGAHPGGVEENSVEIVRRMASIARGPAYPIYAPLVVNDVATARSLRNQPQVADAMKRYRDLTKAIVAIGSWEPAESLVRASLPKSEGAALRKRGVRAEVCARLMDDDGNPLEDLADRVIAITVEELRRVPEVIAVATGTAKAQAIRAVLRGGFVNSLVTDAGAARVLLAEPERAGGRIA